MSSSSSAAAGSSLVYSSKLDLDLLVQLVGLTEKRRSDVCLSRAIENDGDNNDDRYGKQTNKQTEEKKDRNQNQATREILVATTATAVAATYLVLLIVSGRAVFAYVKLLQVTERVEVERPGSCNC